MSKAHFHVVNNCTQIAVEPFMTDDRYQAMKRFDGTAEMMAAAGVAVMGKSTRCTKFADGSAVVWFICNRSCMCDLTEDREALERARLAELANMITDAELDAQREQEQKARVDAQRWQDEHPGEVWL